MSSKDSVSRVGSIRELWRYPVKSMGGERLRRAELRAHGILGDRLWAVRDEREGVITSGKKLPKLMLCTARYVAEPPPDARAGNVPPVLITLPDGRELRSDDPGVHATLSAFLGKEVTLSALRPAEDREHYRAAKTTRAEMRQAFGLGPDEPLPDFSMLPLSILTELSQYATPRGTYFDCYALHLLTTTTLETLRSRAAAADFDVRRFRPNVLIDTNGSASGFVELTWCGGVLSTGGAKILVDAPTPRCSMPTRAQPGLPNEPLILKTIATEAERCAGIYAQVETPGILEAGASIDLITQPSSKLGELAEASATTAKRLILKAAAAAMPKK
jgi:uncharacterized protein YcbX